MAKHESQDYKRALRNTRRRLAKAVQRLQMLHGEPKWDISAWNADVHRAEQELCPALEEYINLRGWASRYHTWIAQHVLWALAPEYMLFAKPNGNLELVKRIVVGTIQVPPQE
jgi:hypothetical protein